MNAEIGTLPKKKRKKKVITSAATCVCFVSLFSLGVWKSGLFDNTPFVSVDDSINIGEKDYISSDELYDNTQENTNNKSSEIVNNNPSDDFFADTDGNVSYFPNNYKPNGSEKIMISSFNVNGTPSASYAAPENGRFCFSIPLHEAMNEYKDSAMYRVVVDLFNNKEHLSSDSSQVQEECNRLSNIGYVVAYETFFDGEFNHYYFTLHATYDELIDFIVNENYGYFMFLYDERVE